VICAENAVRSVHTVLPNFYHTSRVLDSFFPQIRDGLEVLDGVQKSTGYPKGQAKVGVLRASHKICLSLTGKFE
jgi:hypothetical protein